MSKSTKKPVPKKSKEVLYDILLECSILAKDEYWKQFYDDLSSGKSTKGIYISNGTIQTSNKRNGFIYSITDKAPEVILAELHHLLITHTSIGSRKDMTKKRQFVQEIEDEMTEYDKSRWTAIKRKNIRTMLIVDFAIHLNKLHSLSWPATMKAYQTITGAFESKTHTSKDVVYEGGKILSIEDLDCEDGVIVNLRYEQIDSEGETPTELMATTVMLRNLFEPYMTAWVKAIKT